VDLVSNELVCSSQELGSEEDDRGGSIADLLILLCGERDEDSGLGVSGSTKYEESRRTAG
jgi:hypothetical protein